MRFETIQRTTFLPADGVAAAAQARPRTHSAA